MLQPKAKLNSKVVSVLLSMACIAVACSPYPAKPSRVQVANGRSALAGEYPEVVLLQDQTKKGLCSGTFIDATTVLTAAHCTMWSKEVDPDTFEVKNLSFHIVKVIDIAKKEFETLATSTAVYRNPKWDQAVKMIIINPYDLAIVKFENDPSPVEAAIATEKPAVGNPITIVGYGLDYVPNKFAWSIDKSSVGVKRVGVSKVGMLMNGLISLKGTTKTTSADGSNASPSMGDSGGPLFSHEKLIGVTSVGGRFPIILDFAVGVFVDLTSSDSQTFLSRFLQR